MFGYTDEDDEVYHICDNCPSIQQIKRENFVESNSIDERRLCLHCEGLIGPGPDKCDYLSPPLIRVSPS